MSFERDARLPAPARPSRNSVLFAQAYALVYEQVQRLIEPLIAEALERLLADPSARPFDALSPAAGFGRFEVRWTGAEAAQPKGGPLSRREYQVLERIAAGESNKAIARDLNLSPHTVKRHVANILGKLGVASRTQAGAWLRAHH